MILFMAAPRAVIDKELEEVALTSGPTRQVLEMGAKDGKVGYPLWLTRDAAVEFLRSNLGFWPNDFVPMGIYRVKFKGKARAVKGRHPVFGDDGAFSAARKGRIVSRLDVK